MVKRRSLSQSLLVLTFIGVLGAIVLIIPLKIIYELTGNTAYILLFNFDYIPIVNKLEPVWLFGYIFHFVTCIISVIALYYLLKLRDLQWVTLYYVLVYTIGGGGLFFLTALSEQPPSANDTLAWFYWTFAHGIFGFTIGMLVNIWLRKEKRSSFV